MYFEEFLKYYISFVQDKILLLISFFLTAIVFNKFCISFNLVLILTLTLEKRKSF